MPAVVLGTLLIVLSGLLAACSADSPDATSEPTSESTSESTSTGTPVDRAALAGTAYVSTRVDGHDLVPETEIELAFEGDQMSASAGCNTMFASYDLTGTTLAWVAEPASTLIGCEPELADQDQWLAELLTTGVAATSDGESLTLTGDGVTIELTSTAATALQGLLGSRWTAVGTISDGTTSRLPVRTRRPTLSVRNDGLARLFTGCNSGRTTVRINGSSLAFANTRVTRGTCEGPAGETERAVLALLDGPSDHAEVRDTLLIVTKDGQGLLFEIS